MDATRSSRLRRMIAVAAVVAIPSAVLVSCSPSSSADTAATMPPSSRVSHVEATTAAPALRRPPTTTSTTTTTVPVTTTTVAAVVPVTTPPAPVAGCFADVAAQVGWPAEAIPHLTQIIERESHCDPSANTGYRPSTGDWSLGLLQINTLGSLLEARQAACGISAREELLDPATNLRCGLALYNVSGFGPWGG